MNRQPLLPLVLAFLPLVLALIPFVAVGCDKKTGTTTTQPKSSVTGSQSKKSSLPEAPSDVPAQIRAAVERVWPNIEAAGAEIEAAFANVKASRVQGNPPSSADVERAKSAQAKTEEWAEIWNVLNDMVDANQISKAGQRKTERFLQSYDRKVKKWTKLAKSIKELSTVK